MQKMGGGKQRGGGNDPTCGCDMQAGWPSASSFPRGGLQGGGIKEANFSLSWNNNEGKRHSYKGTLKRNMKTNRPDNEAANLNMNMNMNGNNKKTTNKKRNIASSAPNGYSNLAYKGTKYYKKTNSGEVFEITNKGSLGKSMGFYVTPKSGKPYLTQMPPPLENEPMETPEVNLTRTNPVTPPKKTTVKPNTEVPPEPENNEPDSMNTNEEEGDNSPDPESEGVNEEEETKVKSLSMNGGRRRRRHRRVTRRKRHGHRHGHGKKKTQRRKH
jgi:hypothetical protein